MAIESVGVRYYVHLKSLIATHKSHIATHRPYTLYILVNIQLHIIPGQDMEEKGVTYPCTALLAPVNYYSKYSQ